MVFQVLGYQYLKLQHFVVRFLLGQHFCYFISNQDISLFGLVISLFQIITIFLSLLVNLACFILYALFHFFPVLMRNQTHVLSFYDRPCQYLVNCRTKPNKLYCFLKVHLLNVFKYSYFDCPNWIYIFLASSLKNDDVQHFDD